jgi:hypothetical protein
VAEIKEGDPKRQALVEIFDVWWEKHRGEPVKVSDLAPEVTALIPHAHGFDGTVNRQLVTGWLRRTVDTRVGGYGLTKTDGRASGHQVGCYRLSNEPEENR